MRAVVLPVVAAGAALVGGSVIAVTPTAAPPPDLYIANPATRLAAASEVPGPIAAIANIPANEIQALQDLSAALIVGGPWACYPDCTSLGVLLGWDEADRAFGAALVGVLVPFPKIAAPLADNVNAVLLAELPPSPSPDVGCQAIPAPCPDPVGQLKSWYRVPRRQLIASGQVDPIAPLRGLIATLITPSTITPVPSIQDVITTADNLSAGLAVFAAPPTYLDSPAGLRQYVADWRDLVGNLFKGVIAATPATSIPSVSPNSGQTLTVNVDPVAPGGDVEKNEVTGNSDVASPNTQEDSLAVARTPTEARSTQQDGLPIVATATEAPLNAARVLESVSETSAPEGDQGLKTAGMVVERPKPTTATSTNVTRDGNKVERGRVGGSGTNSRGGLAGAVNSVRDRISSAISKVTDGPKGASAKTGEASTDGTTE
jgi:hypothetical protein